MVINFLQKIIWNFKSVTTVATILIVTDFPTGTWVSPKVLGELNTQGCVNVADELFKQVSWSVGQLVEQSLPTPEVRGSNPVIGKHLCTVHYIEWTKIKWKMLEMTHLKTDSFTRKLKHLPRYGYELKCD